MKVIMAAVTSVNAKITKNLDTNIYSWTSPEDQKIFFSLINKHNLIVMGSKTYETVKNIIKLKENKLRIVLTRNPDKYEDQHAPGSLEFTRESPQKLIQRMEKKGCKTMFLVGGSAIYTLFLKNNLVDELYLTIEPKIFGMGKNLINEELLEVKLKLISLKKLNNTGTLFLKYKVLKYPRG